MATVAADGEAHAGRAGGADVIGDGHVRVLLDAADTGTIDNLTSTGAVALTATDVPTLRSMQMKGRLVGRRPGAPKAPPRPRRYCDAFFADVLSSDGGDE